MCNNKDTNKETVKMEFFGAEPKLRTLTEKVSDDYKLIEMLPNEISCDVSLINKIFNFFYSFNSDLSVEFLENKTHLDSKYFAPELMSKAYYYLYGINLVNCLYRYLDDTPDVVFNLRFDDLNDNIDRSSLVKSVGAIFRMRGYKAYTVIPQDEEEQRYFVVINSTDSLASLDKKLLESIAYVKNVILNSSEDATKLPFQVDFDATGVYHYIKDSNLMLVYQIIVSNSLRGLAICTALESAFTTISDKEPKELEIEILEQAMDSIEYIIVALFCEYVSPTTYINTKSSDETAADAVLRDYDVMQMFDKVKATKSEIINLDKYEQITSAYEYVMCKTNDLTAIPNNWKENFVNLMSDTMIKGCKYLYTDFCKAFCINNSLAKLTNLIEPDLRYADSYIKQLISSNDDNIDSLMGDSNTLREDVFE